MVAYETKDGLVVNHYGLYMEGQGHWLSNADLSHKSMHSMLYIIRFG